MFEKVRGRAIGQQDAENGASDEHQQRDQRDPMADVHGFGMI
jgi:hypothetical protein